MDLNVAIALCGIWIGAGIGSAFSKDSQCCGAAMIVSIILVFIK